MPWRVADDPEAKGQIDAYLDGIEDDTVRMMAVALLRREFDRLVENPRLGSGPMGPYEIRPIYKFTLEADGRRYMQVQYRMAEDGWVDIVAFSYSAKA